MIKSPDHSLENVHFSRFYHTPDGTGLSEIAGRLR
jgi:hypothetical protein